MTEIEVWRLAAAAGWGAALLALVGFLLLLRTHATHVRRAQQQVDRLLLLGKSGSVGEAVAAYERLNRLERARDELLEQRRRPAARGADQGEDVARNDGSGAGWFGYLRRPKPPAAPPKGG